MPSLTLPNKALPRQSHEVPPQPISDFLELPWDVRRLIFEKVTTDIWRPMPFGCAGFYYNTKSIEVNILQVSCEVNAGASYSIQNSQADQPCVLAFNPLRHRDVPQAIFETISLARTYDEIYTNRVPKDQKPALAISPLAASLVFETPDCEIKVQFDVISEKVWQCRICLRKTSTHSLPRFFYSCVESQKLSCVFVYPSIS
jgi:hypothetical protein